MFRANSRRLEDLGGGTGHNFCRFVGEGILESISSVLMVGSLILEQILYWEILGYKWIDLTFTFCSTTKG